MIYSPKCCGSLWIDYLVNAGTYSICERAPGEGRYRSQNVMVLVKKLIGMSATGTHKFVCFVLRFSFCSYTGPFNMLSL